MAWLSAVAWSFWEAKEPQNAFPLNRAELAPVLECVKAGLTKGTKMFPGVPSQADALVEYIHQTGAALAFSEENGRDLFGLFAEYQGVDMLVDGLLAFETLDRVRVQLLQTLSILLVNVRKPTFHYVLQTGAYNRLLRGKPYLPDGDAEALYMNIQKRLAMNVDEQAAELLLMTVGHGEDEAPTVHLPLMTEAIGFLFNDENLARTGARVVCLSMLKMKNAEVRAAALEVLEESLLPVLAAALQTSWADIAAAARVGDEAAFRAATCSEEDILEFIGEMLCLGLPGVTQAIADTIVAELLLPQLFVLAAWHQPKPAQPRPIFDCFPDEMKPPAIVPRPSEFSMYQDMLRAMSPSPVASPAAAQDEDEPPDELDAALAVRSIAAFLQQMRREQMTGIMVPMIQLLLWPVVPAHFAERNAMKTVGWKEVRQGFVELSAGHGLEDVALAASEASSAERQHCWRLALRRSTGLRLPGAALQVANPFRTRLCEMMDIAGMAMSTLAMGDDPSFNGEERSLASLPKAASWLLRECAASLYAALLEDAGLLAYCCPDGGVTGVAPVEEVPSPLPSPLPIANEGGGGSFSYLMEAVGSFFRHASCV